MSSVESVHTTTHFRATSAAAVVLVGHRVGGGGWPLVRYRRGKLRRARPRFPNPRKEKERVQVTFACKAAKGA